MLVSMSSALAFAISYSAIPVAISVAIPVSITISISIPVSFPVAVVALGLAKVESPVGTVLSGIGTGRKAKLLHDLTESQSKAIVVGRCSLDPNDGKGCEGGRNDRSSSEMHGE